MAVRRSARLRGNKASSEEPEPQPNNNKRVRNRNKNIENSNNSNESDKLPSVMECNETPKSKSQPTIKTPTTIAKSVHTPLKTPNPSSQKKSVGAKTPTSAIARPSHNDMHPSKIQQSTTKQVDSGLILGFNPIKKDANGNMVKDNVTHDTPTKVKASPSLSQYGTPGFDFRFAYQESKLSEEAKKLMKSIREDVTKIKTQMIQDKSRQTTDGRESEEPNGVDRKIAKPRGKAGRFSDAHIAEFKRMDSIAGHASAFRATPGRFQPVEKTLKRTISKARLDEPESQGSLSKSATKPSPAPAGRDAKRVKYDKTADISVHRSATGEDKVLKRRPTIRSSLMTPTRSSAARYSSVRLSAPRTSMIPSLARSPTSKPTGTTPRTPQTDFNPRIKSNLPTLSGLKSILRRHQPLFSKDPLKIAAGTHLAAPDFSSKFLLGPSSAPAASEEPTTPSPKKRVEFTPTTKSHVELDQASPSPSKPPMAQTHSSSDIFYPTLPVLTPEKNLAAAMSGQDGTPTLCAVRASNVTFQPTTLPDIAGVPHGIGNKKRHRAHIDDEVNAENVPPAESISDGRSAKRLKFSTASPSKVPPTPSPVKARSHTPLRSTPVSSHIGTPASARQKNRGVLSISRLNMLSQPKNRG